MPHTKITKELIDDINMLLDEEQLAQRRQWKEKGACANEDISHWYPPLDSSKHGTKYAKSVCMKCPVRYECLSEAMLQNELHGFWGGRTIRYRRGLRSKIIEVRPEYLNPEHGTISAWHRHVRKSKEPCKECAEAFKNRNKSLEQETVE